MMKQQLEKYLEKVLLTRPRVWDCGRFSLGSLACHAPEVAEFMLGKWPRYANFKEGAEEYSRRGIGSDWEYCEAIVEFSEGRLKQVDDPQMGDLTYQCNMVIDGVGFPAAGVVVGDESAFLNLRGGLMRVPTSSLDYFVRVV